MINTRLYAQHNWLLAATGSKTVAVLTFCLLLSGCLAPALIPAEADLQKISSLLIVPVESPPLSITPDPIETRQPAYRHFVNMVLTQPPLQDSIYRNDANVVMVSQTNPDDAYPTVNRQDTCKGEGLSPLTATKNNWMPSLTLAKQAVAKLKSRKTKVSLSETFYCLAIDQPTDTKAWYDAIVGWYALNQSAAAYRQSNEKPADAVVEVGIGNYRILDSQVSLQVFVKLIDPKTGTVIGRSRAQKFVTGNEAYALLNNDSAPFKRLIEAVGNELLLDDLRKVRLI